MAFKFVLLIAAVLASANAGLLPAHQVYHTAPAAVVSAPVATYAAPAHVATYAAPAHVATYAAPSHVVKVAQPVIAKATEEYDPHPQYKFSYDVQDALSGDSKNQYEERDGDVVRGEYSLIDSDGFKRTVQYTADPLNGFNAVVNREPLVKAVKAVVSAPVAYAAPAPVAHYAAPAQVAYAAPAVVKTVATPVAHYAAPAAYVKSVAPAYTSYAAPIVAHH